MNFIKKLYLTLLRDYFAAKAINLFWINEEELKKIVAGYNPKHETVAKFSYDLAESMLKERENRCE